MDGANSVPATPDEASEVRDLGSPSSVASEESSNPGTPIDAPDAETPSKRVPQLRTVSDPRNMNPNSTALGMLNMARNQPQPSLSGGAGASMDNNVMAKARALHQQRMQKGMMPSTSSPSSPSSQSPPATPATGPNGFAGQPRMPNPLQRPGPGGHPKSAPVLPGASLSERRANKMGMGMKLSDMGGGSGAPSPSSGMRRPGAPKLSDIGGAKPNGDEANGSEPGSRMDDFKKYIDAERGWVTFDGAATITRTGVNFSNGQTFSISLDEVDILSELGKGNYGTVFKVKHARPKMPRFGHGASALRPSQMQQSRSDPSPTRKDDDTPVEPAGRGDGTTGITMAMKEIRLELDDAKFTTILKELVILHECVSPHIIDFYGAFFQEGAVYICIEYMDGGSIDKLYAGGIPENILRKITFSTVMGLKALKDDHNIIHRDVKPTNVLVNTRGQIKICDFGVSGNLVASIAKTNIGCQSYMAPERISGGAMAANADGTYSVQSDIWSLGLTVIECATGHYPYPPEVSSTIFSQLNAIVEGEPPAVPEDYSDMAKDFVRGCLNKVPKLRPTYPMLLNHPWLKPFTKPATITEEAEEGDEADQVADAVGKINLGTGTEDEEVAHWVKSVMHRHSQGPEGDGPSKPALHKAPLDSVSPLGSPLIGAGP